MVKTNRFSWFGFCQEGQYYTGGLLNKIPVQIELSGVSLRM